MSAMRTSHFSAYPIDTVGFPNFKAQTMLWYRVATTVSTRAVCCMRSPMHDIGSTVTNDGTRPGRWARNEVTIASMILASATGSLVMKRIGRPLSTSQSAKLVTFSM